MTIHKAKDSYSKMLLKRIFACRKRGFNDIAYIYTLQLREHLSKIKTKWTTNNDLLLFNISLKLFKLREPLQIWKIKTQILMHIILSYGICSVKQPLSRKL